MAGAKLLYAALMWSVKKKRALTLAVGPFRGNKLETTGKLVLKTHSLFMTLCKKLRETQRMSDEITPVKRDSLSRIEYIFTIFSSTLHPVRRYLVHFQLRTQRESRPTHNSSNNLVQIDHTRADPIRCARWQVSRAHHEHHARLILKY